MDFTASHYWDLFIHSQNWANLLEEEAKKHLDDLLEEATFSSLYFAHVKASYSMKHFQVVREII